MILEYDAAFGAPVRGTRRRGGPQARAGGTARRAGARAGSPRRAVCVCVFLRARSRSCVAVRAGCVARVCCARSQDRAACAQAGHGQMSLELQRAKTAALQQCAAGSGPPESRSVRTARFGVSCRCAISLLLTFNVKLRYRVHRFSWSTSVGCQCVLYPYPGARPPICWRWCGWRRALCSTHLTRFTVA